MTSDTGLHLIPSCDGGARIFLGTQEAAQDRSLLRRYGISRIVCVGTPAFHQAGSVGSTNESGRKGESKAAGFVYLEIPILDLPSENLLAHLDRSASFIADGVRRGENVLVNCVYAQSRSAAVVAGYLMKRENVSLTQAIDRVKGAQPTVHINPGFEAQLELYHDLGCRLPGLTTTTVSMPTSSRKVPEVTVQKERDPKLRAASTYRWFDFASRLKANGGTVWGSASYVGNGDALVSQAEAFRHPKCGSGARGEGETREEEETRGPTTTMLYRCKACRTPLFRDCNVLDHLHPILLAASDSVFASFSRHGDGSSWLKARDAATAAAAAAAKTPAPATKKVAGAKPRQYGVHSRDDVVVKSSSRGVASSEGLGSCSSVFTEPLDWLGIAGSGQRRAKVTCPGRKGAAACGSKLGAWSLEGANCSCGRMVKPAIQFTLSRVECVKRN